MSERFVDKLTAHWLVKIALLQLCW